jgi:hypothetical protein
MRLFNNAVSVAQVVKHRMELEDEFGW